MLLLNVSKKFATYLNLSITNMKTNFVSYARLNLDPSNDKIKIDKTSGIGKLYVERENPIQIEEVIFGPKFPNPEYVTPLLKLLDKDINYKKSTIKFR